MGTVKTGAQDPKYRLGTSEPRTPSTPQSLAQLRDSILDDHVRGLGLAKDHCDYDGDPWPCPPRLLATLLSVENVAAGLAACEMTTWNAKGFDSVEAGAAALLGAIPVGGEIPHE